MFVTLFVSGTGEYMASESDTREQAQSVKNSDGTNASVYTKEEYESRPELWV